MQTVCQIKLMQEKYFSNANFAESDFNLRQLLKKEVEIWIFP